MCFVLLYPVILQTYIAGLKSTAAFLLATAAELEALLEQNTG